MCILLLKTHLLELLMHAVVTQLTDRSTEWSQTQKTAMTQGRECEELFERS